VVPARDEAARIGTCLESLREFLAAGDPVVVVDDGSRDGTAEIAARAGGVVLATGRRARGLAAASGYESLSGSVDSVLIVHADMILPGGVRDLILEALEAHPEAVGGVLGHRIADPRRRFRWVEAGNRIRAAWFQLPYGDQAQFVRTDAVRRAGGFPVQPAFEDLELALRLRAIGRWLYLDRPVLIPNRHWERGVVRTAIGNWVAVVRYLWQRRVAE
jgi:glycosyltransferase involved in cell wall biosynthesis